MLIFDIKSLVESLERKRSEEFNLIGAKYRRK